MNERLSFKQYSFLEGNQSKTVQTLNLGVFMAIARYQFAARSLANARGITIDAACGSGWGTDYLARHTSSDLVIGIDNQQGVVKNASEHFQRRGAIFLCADLGEEGALDGPSKVSNIVSFETIEHLSYEKAVVALRNFHSTHNGEGKLYISTPNRDIFSPYYKYEGRTWDPYHLREYNTGEFENLLKENGWNIDDINGQLFFNPKRYFAITEALYPLRRLRLRAGTSRDDFLGKLAIMAPSLLVAAVTDGRVGPLHPRAQPLFLVATCSKK